jgi:hypothetical protein
LDDESIIKAATPESTIRQRALENLGLKESDLIPGRSRSKKKRKQEAHKVKMYRQQLKAEMNRLTQEGDDTVYDDRQDRLRSFVKDRYTQMVDYTHLLSYDFLRQYLRDRSKALSFIRKELGVPIQNDALEGIVHFLDQRWSDLKGRQLQH